MNQRQPSRRGLLALGATAIAGLTLAPDQLAAMGRPDSRLHRFAPINQVAAEWDREMPKHEVRSGVVIAVEDQWYGPPWQEGEPIVLLHGVAESHVSWQQWIPLLSGQFRTLRPDLPGFGQSPFPASYDCTTNLVAGDLIRLLDELKIARFHLVGAKYGGSTALQMAADYPDRIKSLAVFGAPVKGSPGGQADLTSFADRIRKEGVRSWAAATQRSRLGSDASAEMIRWWTDELMAKSDPRSCIAYTSAAGAMNLEPLLGKITAPTLVVTTESSPLQPVSAARAYQEKIANSKLLVLPGDSYHVAAVRPEECATRLKQFIAAS